jgi:hypothetical protein
MINKFLALLRACRIRQTVQQQFVWRFSSSNWSDLHTAALVMLAARQCLYRAHTFWNISPASSLRLRHHSLHDHIVPESPALHACDRWVQVLGRWIVRISCDRSSLFTARCFIKLVAIGSDKIQSPEYDTEEHIIGTRAWKESWDKHCIFLSHEESLIVLSHTQRQTFAPYPKLSFSCLGHSMWSHPDRSLDHF